MPKIYIAPPGLIGQPDTAAMLQAFYSRSHKSIEERLEEMTGNEYDHKKVKDALAKWFIGYGHESIGDCGNILLFIEGVSMLTAKAIQDHPLYNGQETSSRYIDFTKQPHPFYAGEKYDMLLHTYSECHKALLKEYTSQGLSEKASAVKAFDVARGFLPIGTPTQLSWYGSFRTIRQHLSDIINTHPSAVVRNDARCIWRELVESWPDMFNELPMCTNRLWFLEQKLPDVGKAFPATFNDQWNAKDFTTAWTLTPEEQILMLGDVLLEGWIDYGSYRDIQRHRRMTIKCSVPDTTHLCHSYVDRIPDALKPLFFTDEIYTKSNSDFDSVLQDPLMSYVRAPVRINLPQLKYLIKLRTSPHVHFSARDYVFNIASQVDIHTGTQLAGDLCDLRETKWEKRATQDIVER